MNNRITLLVLFLLGNLMSCQIGKYNVKGDNNNFGQIIYHNEKINYTTEEINYCIEHNILVIQFLQREVDTLKREKEKLKQQFLDEKISTGEYNRKKKNIDTQIKELEDSKSKAKKQTEIFERMRLRDQSFFKEFHDVVVAFDQESFFQGFKDSTIMLVITDGIDLTFDHAYGNPNISTGYYGNPVINKVRDFVLVNEKDNKSKLITYHNDRPVLEFSHCLNIDIKGFTIGHIPYGISGCGEHGIVLAFESCNNTSIENCELFGSGTYGFTLNDCQGFHCQNVQIYECTDGIMLIYDSKYINIVGCRLFNNNCNGSCIDIHNCQDLHFLYVTMEENRSGDIYSDNTYVVSVQSSKGVKFERCTFGNHPDFDYIFTENNSPIVIDNCSYTHNNTDNQIKLSPD